MVDEAKISMKNFCRNRFFSIEKMSYICTPNFERMWRNW